MNAATTDLRATSGGQRYWTPWLTVAATFLAIALLLAIGSVAAPRLPGSTGHAVSHLVIGLPVAGLLFAVLRRWPPARAMRPGRVARGLVTVGLAGVVIGQVLEVVGTRVDEPGATVIEDIAHTAGMIVTTLSLPVVALGTIAALVAAARDGSVPWWVVGLVGVVATALLGVMIVGAPDGS